MRFVLIGFFYGFVVGALWILPRQPPAAGGVYFCRLVGENAMQTIKASLVR